MNPREWLPIDEAVALTASRMNIGEQFARKLVDAADRRGKIEGRRSLISQELTWVKSHSFRIWSSSLVASDNVEKNRRGPPFKFDWEGAAFELGFVTSDMSPNQITKEFLTDTYRNYFTKHDRDNGGPKDPKEIKKRVDRFYKRLIQGADHRDN